jgi:hypothetical protein
MHNPPTPPDFNDLDHFPPLYRTGGVSLTTTKSKIHRHAQPAKKPLTSTTPTNSLLFPALTALVPPPRTDHMGRWTNPLHPSHPSPRTVPRSRPTTAIPIGPPPARSNTTLHLLIQITGCSLFRSRNTPGDLRWGATSEGKLREMGMMRRIMSERRVNVRKLGVRRQAAERDVLETLNEVAM